MPKAILIQTNSQTECSIKEIQINEKDIFTNLKKIIGAKTIDGISLAHFEPKYRLTLFFDDEFSKNNQPTNLIASKFAQKTKYSEQFDQDLYLDGNCVLVNENDEQMIDITIKEFKQLLKLADLITPIDKLKNKQQADINWQKFMNKLNK